MIGKSALYALAVAVLMGAMAVAALANDQGMYSYGPGDASLSVDPERIVGQLDDVEIRGPVETGSIPDQLEGSSELFRMATGEEPTVEIGGQVFRPSTDTGP